MKAAKKIRLLIADDHPVVREGLSAILSHRPEMAVVATACDGRSAVNEFLRCRPDVTLLDLRMPDIDGIDVMREIRESDPKARVIILTTYDDHEDIFRAVQAGASAYLLKDVPREQLLECIRAVYRYKICLPPSISAKLVARISHHDLTARELEVLRWMAAGLANKEIGTALKITEGTVKLHVNHLMQKLGANSRTGAVRVALDRGLVRLGGPTIPA